MIFNIRVDKIIVYIILSITINHQVSAMNPILSFTEDPISTEVSDVPFDGPRLYIKDGKKDILYFVQITPDDVIIAHKKTTTSHQNTPQKTEISISLSNDNFIASLDKKILNNNASWACLYNQNKLCLIPLNQESPQKKIEHSECKKIDFGNDEKIVQITFSENSQTLLVITKNQSENKITIVLIHLKKQPVLYAKSYNTPNFLKNAELSPDGKIISIPLDNVLLIINMEENSGEQEIDFDQNEEILQTTLSNNGRYLYLITKIPDAQLKTQLIDLKEQIIIYTHDYSLQKQFKNATFSPDSNILAILFEETLCIINIKEKITILKPLKGRYEKTKITDVLSYDDDTYPWPQSFY